MSFLKDFFKKLKTHEKPKPSYSYLNLFNPMDIWNVEGEIGDGAFGKVYKAKNRNDAVVAALKQVNLEEESDLEEYMVEIEILTECKHSNIVNLYAAYNFEGKLWMALEFCNGGAIDSLMEHLDKNLNEKAIKYIAKEVLSGLIFLHNHNVIHRDMKAGNVLVTQNAEVKLADFGVSARLSADRQKRNTVQGTPYWMAPEVIACQNMESYYDCRVDIWSFGITLIEFAQMRPPYHQMQPSRVLIKIAKAEPPTLERPRMWSNEFNSFLKLCLTKNPDQRPYGAELLKDPFIESCNESDLKALKVLIHEARAENIEETEEELDLKDVRNSIIPSETLDDISKFSEDTDDVSIESTETQPIPPTQPTFSDDNIKNKNVAVIDDILENIIMEQLKSEEDKMSILGVVCDAIQEHNPRTNIDDTVASLGGDDRLNRRNSMQMAMETVPVDEEILKEPVIPDKTGDDEKNGDEEKEEVNVENNINRRKSCYKTMTKTRKFVVDGEEITTTTKKVVREGLENKSHDQLQERKMEIRELKILAKEESRQKRQLLFKMNTERDILSNKQKFDEQNAERIFDNDMTNLSKSHKMKLEKLETSNYNEIQTTHRKLLADKVKSENDYKAKDKSDLNKELNKVSKENVKKIRENHNLVFLETLKDFQAGLDKEIEKKIEIMTKTNRKKMEELETSFLKESYTKNIKQGNLRAKISVEQCLAMYQLETQHNKDLFMLRRQQEKHRQEKEMEQLEKSNKKDLEYLDSIEQSERKSFPRSVKNVSKTRSIQKKNELQTQLDKNVITANELRAKLKEFKENERVRESDDLKQMEQKLLMRRDALLKEHSKRCREYEQLHAEQKKELTDQENYFMKDFEKTHRENIAKLNKLFEEKEVECEIEFRSREKKLRTFYNADVESKGCITSYSTKDVNDDGGVEHLC